ncbi:dGTPase [Marisediminitalea aggregata]|uniref:dGTPase n=1 Tax=Marisediminitalea aggregata TaxID=634436 RepID=A0A1M5H9C5_9ALTE|nr:dNTP triphosphohydrolase [Marisediminitalea aggregata]SHG12551.1 dGTPase [Marisediminitalea aggregata]
MLDWQKLLNGARRKDKKLGSAISESSAGRLELERDYDRILFATPTRRMADKTQVFPLESIDSVRTRLTHSHEVSNLARSIGVRLAFDYAEEVFGENAAELNVQRVVPSLLAAIGLAHDIGNPPFGHQGEVAIREWFKEKLKDKLKEEPKLKDFTEFDGNAQTLRMLSRLQILNDDFGLNLTYATLASLIKYPQFSLSTDKIFKKPGVFESEREVAEEIWSETGLGEGVRHPFTFVMEACDDIAYSVIDAEDIIKKGLASFQDLISYLKKHANHNGKVLSLISKSEGKFEEFSKEELSGAELSDISMQMFRVYAIAEMVKDSVDTFVKDKNIILSGKAKNYELIEKSDSAYLCKTLKRFAFEFGFQHKDVLKLELNGSHYIKNTLDMLWEALNGLSGNSLFDKYVKARISESYTRVYNGRSDKDTTYAKAQLLADFVSGMTDSYLIKFHDDLKAVHGSNS